MTAAPTGFDWAMMALELSKDEGTRLTVYDDATGQPITPGHICQGHPTIGIGRALDVDGITHNEASVMLLNDLQRYLAELYRLAWFAALDTTRQRAIVNMRHQLGLAGLLAFHDMITAIECSEWSRAFEAGLNSLWGRQVPMRAHRVMSQLRDGNIFAVTPTVST